MLSNKEELVYIDCFYYSFYIKKSELNKYNIKSELLIQNNQKIIKEHKNPTIKNYNSLSHNIDHKLNINNSYNTLNSSRVLEQLNSCNFTINYNLLTLKNIIKMCKNIYHKCHNVIM